VELKIRQERGWIDGAKIDAWQQVQVHETNGRENWCPRKAATHHIVRHGIKSGMKWNGGAIMAAALCGTPQRCCNWGERAPIKHVFLFKMLCAALCIHSLFQASCTGWRQQLGAAAQGVGSRPLAGAAACLPMACRQPAAAATTAAAPVRHSKGCSCWQESGSQPLG
jgi:hypothetical protein